ncbi:MAG: tetratricopeptide repeat protein [Bacteroidetes bacterium]|nr:tetratricopeptide repeat protein [Bacteroidota bacterium]
MNQFLKIKSSAFLLALIMIISLLADLNAFSNPVRKKNRPDPKDTSRIHQTYGSVAMLIEAKKYQITDNLLKAEEVYRQYIDRFPLDPVAYYELSRILGNKKEYPEAIKLSQKAVSLNSSNTWYRLYLADLYQEQGDYKNAVDIYEKIITEHPDNLDNYYQLAVLYIVAGKYHDAAGIYDKIEGKTGISEDISLQKEKIWLHLNDLQKAEAELQKLVNSDPTNTRFLSLIAEFYISNQLYEKALNIYNEIIAIDPANPYIHMSMADYYRKTGNKEKAYDELKLGFANPNLDIDTKVNILLSFYTINQLYSDLKDQAMTLAKILIDTHPAEPKAHSIYGDLLLQDKQYPVARDEFIKVITLDSSKYVVWEQVIRLDLQLEKYDHLLEFSNRTSELFPEQPIPWLFSGMANYQMKKYDDALNVLKSGVKLVVDNDELLSEFYMSLGDTYHALKIPEESDKAYDKALQLKDNNPYVLNNYSYYLSLRNKDLDKAEKMAKKALTLDPDNSSFEDTYGWVLYKLGRFEEAKTWIAKALQDKESSSGEVLEHYGDVLFKLGDEENAVEYWIKAKGKGPGSEFLEKKIVNKKLYE